MIQKELSSVNYKLLYNDANSNFLKQFLWKQDEVPPDFAHITKDSSLTFSNNFFNKKIIQCKVINTHEFKPSIFVPHQLTVHNNNPHQLPISNTVWLSFVLSFVLILLALVRINFNKKIKQLFKAYTEFRFFNQLIREGNFLHEKYTYLLLIIFIINISVFIFNSYFNFIDNTLFGWNGIKGLFYIMFFIIIWLLFKFLIINFLGFVFKLQKEAFEQLANILMFFEIVGLMIFPLSLFCAFNFSSIVFCIGVIVLTVLYFNFIIRCIMIQLANINFSILNLILYLCIFEVLPIVVVIKILLLRGNL